MQELNLIEDNVLITKGTVVRLFRVGRFDVKHKIVNKNNVATEAEDYYDYILVDAGVVSEGAYMFVNITRDNPNRGAVLWCFENSGDVIALILKKYFGKAKVLIELNK